MSNLWIAGVPPNEIQALARHRDIWTTMEYSHLAPGRLQQAMDALGAARVPDENGNGKGPTSC